MFSRSRKSRNPTPYWTGSDVLVFFTLWFAAHIVCGIATGYVDTPSEVQTQTASTPEKHHGHPIAQLIEQNKNSATVFFIIFCAVVVAAPLVEEILFRLFLQGWLESKLAQYAIPYSSCIAIVAVSYFFAMLHGGNRSNLNEQMLIPMFVGTAFFGAAIFILGVYYLVTKRGMTITQCLLGPEPFFRPKFFVKAGYALLAVGLILGFTAVLRALFPDINTDPVPLFLFSLLLGFMYSRTQNLSYCILLHACLNLTSLTIAWLA